jgi:hypothetical protein
MRPLLALALLAFALSACAHSEMDMVRALAASDNHCDASTVTVRKTGQPFPRETLYEASACQHVVVYRCTRPVTDELEKSIPTPAENRTECKVDSGASGNP